VGFGTEYSKLGEGGANLVELQCHTQHDFYCQVTASCRGGGGFLAEGWFFERGLSGSVPCEFFELSFTLPYC